MVTRQRLAGTGSRPLSSECHNLLATRKTIVTGVLCALCATVIVADQTEWTDAGSGPKWDVGTNWNNGVPDNAVDALHTSSSSDILVNITNAECLTFTGDGDVPTDRFLVVDGSQHLHTFGNVSENGRMGRNFKFKFENGTDALRTKLTVDGSVADYDLIPTTGIGNRGEYVTIDVTGDVTDSTLSLGNHATVTVGGDVTGPGGDAWVVKDNGTVAITGDLTGVGLTLGTSAAGSGDGTSFSVDRIGTTGTHYSDDCTFSGYTAVTVDTRIRCNTSAAPLGAEFMVEDNAVVSVVGLPETIPAPTIIRGTWTVTDGAVVKTGTATFNGAVAKGWWTVEKNALLDFSWRYFPLELTVDGGEARAPIIGWPGDLGLSEPWDLTIKGGGKVTVESSETSGGGVIGGLHPGIGHGFFSNSTITYTGTSNTYTTVGPIEIGGTLVNSTGSASLDMDSEMGLIVRSKIVNSANDTGISFDTEGVSVTLASTTSSPNLEVFGPDFDADNGGKVLFTDSPTTRRWADLTVDSTSDVNLQNDFTSTLITCTSSSCTGSEVPEALYVKDLTVVSGTVLKTNDLNIYYTGTLTPNPPASGSILDGSASDYVPVKLTATRYGNFNGTRVAGTDSADVTRFNDAYCTSLGDADYDHLVDWNDDGLINCVDRSQFMGNWA